MTMRRKAGFMVGWRMRGSLLELRLRFSFRSIGRLRSSPTAAGGGIEASGASWDASGLFPFVTKESGVRALRPAGHGRQQEDRRALGDLRIESAEEPDVVAVDEHVEKARHAVPFEHARAQGRIRRHQL